MSFPYLHGIGRSAWFVNSKDYRLIVLKKVQKVFYAVYPPATAKT